MLTDENVVITVLSPR